MTSKSLKITIRITWIIILLCVLALAFMFKLFLVDNHFDREWYFLIYSIPLLISSVVFIMALYSLKHANARQGKGFERDEKIAEWKYSEVEWDLYNRSVWKKNRSKALEAPVVFLILFVLIGILSKGFSSDAIRFALPIIIFLFVSISAIIFFFNYALYQRAQTSPREIVIGRHGFLFGGYYNSWENSKATFTGARFVPGTIPVLEFDVKIWSKFGERANPLSVPVPAGKEDEAEKVAAELSKN